LLGLVWFCFFKSHYLNKEGLNKAFGLRKYNVLIPFIRTMIDIALKAYVNIPPEL